jgi:hypothetical protein
MKRCIMFLALILVSAISKAQEIDNENNNQHPYVFFGLGAGLNYGGVGSRLTIMPVKPWDIYAGVGYAIVGLGYNIGTHVRIAPDRLVCPVFGAMYGYNGVIKIQGASQFDKIYYGPSISGGIQLKTKGSSYFSAELVVPFRSKSFYNDWDALKNQSNITVKNAPLPVTISIGYHFAFE